MCEWFANQVVEATDSQTVSGGWRVQLNKRKRKEEKKEWDRLIKNETDTKRKQMVRLGGRRRRNGALGDNIKKSHAFVISQSVFFSIRRILMNMDESADVTVPLLRINTLYFTVFTRLSTANIFSAVLCPLLLHLLSFFLFQENRALGVLFYNPYTYCILESQLLWKVDLTKWLYFVCTRRIENFFFENIRIAVIFSCNSQPC